MTSTVYQWKDRNGNASNALHTIGAASGPTYNPTALNGKGGMVFDGNASYLATLGNPNFSTETLWNAAGSTIFSIEASLGLDSARLDLFAIGNAPGGGYQQFGFQDYGSYIDYSSSAGNRIHLSQPDSNPHIYMILAAIDGGGTVSRVINFDGTTAATDTPGEVPGTVNVPLEIAGSIPGTLNGQPYGYPGQAYWYGSKYELIFYNRSLTQTEYQQVEGYIAWKWGLQANLPVGHPYASAAPVGFAPSDISGLGAWYDAADASTIETFPSGPIVAWNDLSGNSNTLSVDPAAIAPTYNDNSLNGLGGVNFNPSGGVAQLTTLESPNFSTETFWNAAGSTFIFVEQSDGRNGYNMATAVSDSLFYSINDKARFFDYAGAYGNRTQVTGVDGNAHLYSIIASLPSTTGNIQTNLDGATYDTRDSGETPGTTGVPFEVGGNLPGTLGGVAYGKSDGATYPWSGTKYELLVFNRTLTQAEYQEAEGYLAWKWGLQGNLPGGHPYQSAAPVGYTPSSVSGLSAWWDASNVDSIVVPITTTAALSAGASVLPFVPATGTMIEWLDRSGNGNTLLPASTGEAPSVTNTGNSTQGSVLFTRAKATQLTSANHSFSQILYNASGATSFFVAAVEDVTSELDWLFYCGDNNAPTYGAFLADGTFSEAFGGYSPRLGVTFPHGSAAHILTVQNIPSTSGFLNFDGTSAGTYTPNGNPGHNAPLQIGDAQPSPTGGISDYGNSSAPLQGEVNEMLFFSAALSQSDYQKVEGYLAWKWSLQANLPSGHPYASAPPAGFTPSSVSGLSAWYDASDAATVIAETVQSIGAAMSVVADYTIPVGQWLDQSGNGLPLQAFSLTQEPSFERLSLNGHGGVSFTSPDLLFSLDQQFSTDVLWNPAGSTVFTLEKSSNPGSQEFDIFAGVGASFWSFQNAGQFVDYNTQNGNSINLSVSDTNPHLYMINSSISGGVVSTVVDLDGTQAASNTQTTPPGTNKYPLEVGGAQTGIGEFGPFGRVGQGAFAWGGTKYEMIFFNRPLTQTEYQQVEGYMMWKWAQQASLPSGHPYKSAPPAGFTPASLSGLAAWYDAANADSILQLGIQQLGAGAVLLGVVDQSVDAAAILSVDGVATIDAAMSISTFFTATATVDANAILSGMQSDTVDAGAELSASAIAPIEANSLVVATQTSDIDASAFLSVTPVATVNANAQIAALSTSPITAAAQLLGSTVATIDTSAQVSALATSPLAAGAKVFTATIPGTLAADATVSQQAGTSATAASYVTHSSSTAITAASEVAASASEMLGAGSQVAANTSRMVNAGAQTSAGIVQAIEASALLQSIGTVTTAASATVSQLASSMLAANTEVSAQASLAANAGAEIAMFVTASLDAAAELTADVQTPIDAGAVVVTSVNSTLGARLHVSALVATQIAASSMVTAPVVCQLTAGAMISASPTSSLEALAQIVTMPTDTIGAASLVSVTPTTSANAGAMLQQSAFTVIAANSLIDATPVATINAAAFLTPMVTTTATIGADTVVVIPGMVFLAAGAFVQEFQATATVAAASSIAHVLSTTIAASTRVKVTGSTTITAATIATAHTFSIINANSRVLGLVNAQLAASARVTGVTNATIVASAAIAAKATPHLPASAIISRVAKPTISASSAVSLSASNMLGAGMRLVSVGVAQLHANTYIVGKPIMSIAAGARIISHSLPTLSAGASIGKTASKFIEAAMILKPSGLGHVLIGAGSSISITPHKIMTAAMRVLGIAKPSISAGMNLSFLGTQMIEAAVNIAERLQSTITAGLSVSAKATTAITAYAYVLGAALGNVTIGATASVEAVGNATIDAASAIGQDVTVTLDASASVAPTVTATIGASAEIVNVGTVSIDAGMDVNTIATATASAGAYVYQPNFTFTQIGAASAVLGLGEQQLAAGAIVTLPAMVETLGAGMLIFTPWVPILSAHARIVNMPRMSINAGARVGVLAQNGINREVSVEPYY